MFKKKTLFIFLLLFMTCLFCSCGEKKEVKDDRVFIDNLSKALEARWVKADLDISQMEGTEYRNYLKTQCVQTELDILGSYDDYIFSDAHLADLAKQYYEALENQYEGADYFDIDDVKHEKLFYIEGYNVRASILKELAEDYGLTVSDNHKSELDEFITVGGVVDEDNALKEHVQKILDNLNFEKTGNSGTWSTYTATIENTTEVSFSYFNITVDLLDESGMVVEQDYCYIDHWASGHKNQIEFSTDKSFFTMSFTADYYEE